MPRHVTFGMPGDFETAEQAHLPPTQDAATEQMPVEQAHGTGADVHQGTAPIYRGGAGSGFRRQLNALAEEDRAARPEPAPRLQPNLDDEFPNENIDDDFAGWNALHFDNEGIAPYSLPSEIQRLLTLATRYPSEMPDVVRHLSTFAVLDVGIADFCSMMFNRTAMGSLSNELLASKNDLARQAGLAQVDIPGTAVTDQSLNISKLNAAAYAVLNLVGLASAAASLYYGSRDPSLKGLAGRALTLAAQVSASVMHADIFLRARQLQTAINESRTARENLPAQPAATHSEPGMPEHLELLRMSVETQEIQMKFREYIELHPAPTPLEILKQMAIKMGVLLQLSGLLPAPPAWLTRYLPG